MVRICLTVSLVVLSVIWCGCNGATTGRKPGQPEIIPTNQDKGKSTPVSHRAFANAGTKPGLEIWRIEKFEPIPVPANNYGQFHTGDSYIVLSTKDVGGKKTWDIYFWLGSETSQDESGAAAIYTVQLDDKLNKQAVQHREVQGEESGNFKNLFKNFKVIPGGVPSGLRHVDTTVQKHMYVIKGKKNIRVKEVEPSAASLNKGDCFIFDNGPQIYVYQGPKSNRIEKLKSVSAANVIKDVDRNGRSKVTIIDGDNNQDELLHFLEVLGAPKSATIPSDVTGVDDAQFERNEENSASLHKVSETSGTVKVEKINQKPLKQEMLNTNDCFILDAEKSIVYYWCGKKASPKEKEEAKKKAEDVKKTKKYPAWVKVEKVIENAEPSLFRQYFLTWKGVGESHSRLI